MVDNLKPLCKLRWHMVQFSFQPRHHKYRHYAAPVKDMISMIKVQYWDKVMYCLKRPDGQQTNHHIVPKILRHDLLSYVYTII